MKTQAIFCSNLQNNIICKRMTVVNYLNSPYKYFIWDEYVINTRQNKELILYWAYSPKNDINVLIDPSSEEIVFSGYTSWKSFEDKNYRTSLTAKDI